MDKLYEPLQVLWSIQVNNSYFNATLRKCTKMKNESSILKLSSKIFIINPITYVLSLHWTALLLVQPSTDLCFYFGDKTSAQFHCPLWLYILVYHSESLLVDRHQVCLFGDYLHLQLNLRIPWNQLFSLFIQLRNY